LGKDFVLSSALVVRIGLIDITPKFHTDGTLLVTIPEGSVIREHALSTAIIKPGEPLVFPVLVTNDGNSFSSPEPCCQLRFV
jgi:hypothetical protein